MKLYWAKNTRAFRIAWLLEESGLAYERVVMDLRDPAMKNDPAFRKVSPLGKVPALEDGATTATDSGAICIYIADQYPDARLGPKVGDPKRAEFLHWTLFTNSMIEPAIAERVTKMEPRPTSSFGWGSFDLTLETLRAGVANANAKGPWMLGEQFTAADVLIGTSCYYLNRFGLVKEDAVLDPYVARCTARPAWARAQAFDA